MTRLDVVDPPARVGELHPDAHRLAHRLHGVLEAGLVGVLTNKPELEQREAAARDDRVPEARSRGREDDEGRRRDAIAERVPLLHDELVAALVHAVELKVDLGVLADGEVAAVERVPVAAEERRGDLTVEGRLPVDALEQPVGDPPGGNTSITPRSTASLTNAA